MGRSLTALEQHNRYKQSRFPEPIASLRRAAWLQNRAMNSEDAEVLDRWLSLEPISHDDFLEEEEELRISLRAIGTNRSPAINFSSRHIVRKMERTTCQTTNDSSTSDGSMNDGDDLTQFRFEGREKVGGASR